MILLKIAVLIVISFHSKKDINLMCIKKSSHVLICIIHNWLRNHCVTILEKNIKKKCVFNQLMWLNSMQCMYCAVLFCKKFVLKINLGNKNLPNKIVNFLSMYVLSPFIITCYTKFVHIFDIDSINIPLYRIPSVFKNNIRITMMK